MNRSVLVLNGPGLADPSVYSEFHDGTLSLPAIRTACEAVGSQLGLELDFRQTDNMDEMSRWIASDIAAHDGIVVNPASRSHAHAQSLELYRSALKNIADLGKPVIEVHIDNIYRREADQLSHQPFGEMGFVCGLGKYGYVLAIQSIARKLAAC